MSELVDVIIVGAGISGIGMAAHLKASCPGKSFAILERRARIGGTWDLFRYPGVRSDSDMHTLGFAFAPWRHEKAIAGGETILAYLEGVVEEHALRPHIQLGCHVKAADWDSTAALWRVTWTDQDGTGQTACRFLFLGAGYYDHDQPHAARIPGLDRFAGATIHPQFWPQDFDSTNKSIVVIGSGATAATLVPALARQASKVTMLQRTPSWYLSVPSRDGIAKALRRHLPERLAYRMIRAKNVLVQDVFFRRARKKPAKVAEFLKGQVRRRLGERYDEQAFSPPYGPWEQRLCIVPDGDFFKALRSGKAEIVTGRIAEVLEDGIRLQDGRILAADVIVTATGLRMALAGNIALSLDGKALKLADHFYYRNCMFSNVPNLAAMFGYLNASWTLRVDVVSEWLCRLIKQMDAWGMDVVTPVLPADHDLVEEPILDLFSSGYLRRARHLIPKSAATPPWRISMDYRSDRAEMHRAPVDDGVLQFARAKAR